MALELRPLSPGLRCFILGPLSEVLMAIDVHVTGGGIISNGELREDAGTVARCTICAAEVDAAATIGEASACAPCLRARLDALSVARFRLRPTPSASLPWGKVSG